jgi:acyl carrier protein
LARKHVGLQPPGYAFALLLYPRASIPCPSIITPMHQPEIYEKLTTLCRDIFDDDNLVLSPGLTAAEVPEWDSFNHINLIVAVESKFGIKFQTAELESMHTVGHLADLIQTKLAAQHR